MAAAADRSGRHAADVELVAVSKGHGVESVTEAYRSGHRTFGENRSDELVAKAAVLPGDIEWHFVGQLQSRKTSEVAAVATVVQSVDRAKLVRRLSAVAIAGTGNPDVYVQVNLAAEPQKGGANPAAVPGLIELAEDHGLVVRGLMIIPPLADDPEETRPWFVSLRRLRDQIVTRFPSVTGLSMGMTDDYEVAIEEGATLIRVGRAIFGERRGGKPPILLTPNRDEETKD